MAGIHGQECKIALKGKLINQTRGHNEFTGDLREPVQL